MLATIRKPCANASDKVLSVQAVENIPLYEGWLEEAAAFLAGAAEPVFLGGMLSGGDEQIEESMNFRTRYRTSMFGVVVGGWWAGMDGHSSAGAL